MKSELQVLNDITLVGISILTNYKNESNSRTSKIRKLANKFLAENSASKIVNRINPGVTISAYANYETDEYGSYKYFIGEQVSSIRDLPACFEVLTIPAGRYLKYTTRQGSIPEVVVKSWHKIWKIFRKRRIAHCRKYQVDFEIYDQRAINPQKAILDIYVSVE